MAFRGEGAPEDGDLIYGSIYSTALEDETIVGLQSKLLFLLNVLQKTDARPTVATQEAAKQLHTRVGEMVALWKSEYE